MTPAEHRYFLWVLLLIFLSRLPFLNAGYGAEEYAWAMRLVTERIADTGQYEVSRLPGHPLQELTYAMLWNRDASSYNMVTVLLSTAAIAFFMLTLRKLQITNYLWAGIAMGFVPVVYINSTNALDYTWALCFLMMSFYFIVCNNYWIAGMFIGLAVGCRITSGAMLIPFIYLTWCISQNTDNKSLRESVMPNQVGHDDNYAMKNIIKLTIATLFFSLLLFLPVIKVYGLNFFQYYEHFPLPSFAKNFYKGTFAVWGTLGFIIVMTAALISFLKINLKEIFLQHKKIIYMSLIVVLIYTAAFIKLPLKAAFMIPLIPFVVLLFAITLSQKQFKLFSLTMIVSSFFFGINLYDPYRAAAASPMSFQTTFSNQPVSFDFLQGPVIADYLKRKQQMAYADKLIQKSSTIKNKTLIIAGWWMANILVQQQGRSNTNVIYRYYLPENELKYFQDHDYKIFYLPQQDEYNDLRYGGNFTKHYASLLNI